jgi:hypothetical protein
MHCPAYGSDLVTSDVCLFGPFKKQVAGSQVTADANMKQAVSWLQTLHTSFFFAMIQA